MSEVNFTTLEFAPVAPPLPDPKDSFCTSCHYIGRGRYPGSLWFYIPLALAWVLPAVLYYIYRTMSGQSVCFKCGKKTLIPTTSPAALMFIAEDHIRSGRNKSSTEVRASRNTGEGGNPLIETEEIFEAELFGDCESSVFTLKTSVDPERAFATIIPPFVPGAFMRLLNSFSVEIKHPRDAGGKRVGVRVVQMRPEALKMAKAIVGEGAGDVRK